jgi:hypothetical protein
MTVRGAPVRAFIVPLNLVKPSGFSVCVRACVRVCVCVKFTLEQALKAQRGSRGIALLLL